MGVSRPWPPRVTPSKLTRRTPAAGAFLAIGLAGSAARARAPVPLELPGGARLEHRPLELHGLPVRGATVTVPVGAASGAVAPADLLAPQLLPAEARVAATGVPDAVQRALHLAAPPSLVGAPRLVYFVVLGHPVLAWEAELPLQLSPEPSRRTVWIGAGAGKLLAEREHVVASRARVFLTNPARSPEAVEVELGGLAPTGAGWPLVGERVTAYNCLLEAPGEDLPWWQEGECHPTQTVFSDDAGDYFVPVPDVRKIGDNLVGDDPFAELSMYHHAERFLSAMEALGVTQFRCPRATMLANFRYATPAYSYPELSFGPLNNAYFTDQCNPIWGPTMLFGQGSAVDFAFDGDVVYHELGHGIVVALAPEGLWGRRLRPDAFVNDARGINEAVADYLSAIVAGDGDLGDYVARYWPSYTRPYLRSGQTQKQCGLDTIGQEHNDGEPMMGALWTTRERIGEVLDGIVVEALTRLEGDADLEQMARRLLEVADLRVAAGQLDPQGRGVLWRALEARGLLDCPRILADEEALLAGRSLWLVRRTDGVTPFFPGPLQFRHVVPEGSDNLLVGFSLFPRPTSTGNPLTTPVAARVLVKRSAAPITFEYDLVAFESGVEVAETTLVQGDWDAEYVVPDGPGQELVVIRGLQTGEVVHIMVVNDSTEADAVADLARVWSVPADQLDEGDESIPHGEDPERPPGGGAAGDLPSEGCACGAGGAGAPPCALAGLLCLVVCRPRRRQWAVPRRAR